MRGHRASFVARERAAHIGDELFEARVLMSAVARLGVASHHGGERAQGALEGADDGGA